MAQESQKLMKRKLVGRDYDLQATYRIKDIVTQGKKDIKKISDENTPKPSYIDLDSSDLEAYKQDLSYRLMLFESEANDIRIEIKEISALQSNSK